MSMQCICQVCATGMKASQRLAGLLPRVKTVARNFDSAEQAQHFGNELGKQLAEKGVPINEWQKYGHHWFSVYSKAQNPKLKILAALSKLGYTPWIRNRQVMVHNKIGWPILVTDSELVLLGQSVPRWARILEALGSAVTDKPMFSTQKPLGYLKFSVPLAEAQSSFSKTLKGVGFVKEGEGLLVSKEDDLELSYTKTETAMQCTLQQPKTELLLDQSRFDSPGRRIGGPVKAPEAPKVPPAFTPPELPRPTYQHPESPEQPPEPPKVPPSVILTQPDAAIIKKDNSQVPHIGIPATLAAQYPSLSYGNKLQLMQLWMRSLWNFLNEHKFESRMKMPTISFIKNVARMRTRGYWRAHTRELKIAPRLFNAPLAAFIEIFLHEMCVSGDALVPTDLGLIRMDEVQEKGARWVATRKGKARIIKWWCSGTKQTWKISTEFGNSLRLTDNHPVLVLNDKCKFVWRRVDELRIGDYMVSRKGSVVNESEVGDLSYALEDQIGIGYLKQPTPKFPIKMTNKLARLLGYLAAEGSFVEGANSNTVEFANGDPDVLHDFIDCWKSCFGFTPSVRRYGDKDCYSVHATRKDLAAWLTSIGFARGKAPTKEVPNSVLTASTEHQIHFLRAFIEGDGSIGPKGGLSVTSASEKMLHQMKLMFLGLGLVSMLERKSARGTFNEAGRYFRLRVFDGHLAVKTIGVVSEHRRALMVGALQYHKTKIQSQLGKHWKIPYVGSWLRSLGLKEVRSLANGDLYPAAVENALTHLRGKFLKRACNLLGDFNFEQVISIEKGLVEKVYDMTTSKGQFVANGLVIHNCHQAVSEISNTVDREQGGHGPYWRGWMMKVGLNPSRYDHNDSDIYLTEEEQSEAKELREKAENNKKELDLKPEWNLMVGNVVRIALERGSVIKTGVIAGKMSGDRYIVVVDPTGGQFWKMPPSLIYKVDLNTDTSQFKTSEWLRAIDRVQVHFKIKKEVRELKKQSRYGY